MRFHFPATLAVAVALTLGAGCGSPTDEPRTTSEPTSVVGRQAADRGNGPFTCTHILIASRNLDMPTIERSKTQALTAALAVMEKLKSGTSIESVVASYTDDKASIARPGEKDGQYKDFPAGMMVPEFERAVRETPIGKIFPEPVETKFGYHIIRRDK